VREAAASVRAVVAAQLEELTAAGGALSSSGPRATIRLSDNYTAGGHPSRRRRRLRREVIARYLARRRDVRRESRVALLTAGPPGAGKTTALNDLGLATRGWRRLDADVVKEYLVEDAVQSGRYADLLGRELADGHPIMPAELASLMHIESVSVVDDIRVECLRRGENVIIEGTLGWVPYGVVAGRGERAAGGGGWGGRYTPTAVIDRLFTPADAPRSVCAANARALFDSPAARDVAIMTLTVHDSTSGALAIAKHQRRSGQRGS
jgi:hypothetical protein